MTRTIAGAAGGRRLATPGGAGTRPTSDRVREALFSRLDHLDAIVGAPVLDLYAGSGALGLEALSRGAADVVLVESARRAADLARRNGRLVEGSAAGGDRGDRGERGEVGTERRVQVRAEPVLRYLGGQASPVDLAFLDPPYDLSEAELGRVLAALVAHLNPGALVVVERSTRSPEPDWPTNGPGLRRSDARRYGETCVWFAELR